MKKKRRVVREGMVTRKVVSMPMGKKAEKSERIDPIKKSRSDGTCVETSLGTTISKDYNSVRIDVSVRFPTTKARSQESLREAWDLCGEELSAQLEQARVFLAKL